MKMSVLELLRLLSLKPPKDTVNWVFYQIPPSIQENVFELKEFLRSKLFRFKMLYIGEH